MEQILELEMTHEHRVAIVEQLMLENGSRILHTVYHYVKNRQAAEDLTQEIFTKCYEKLHTFKGNSSIETWLYRLAINHTKDYMRSWHAKNVLIDEMAIEAAVSAHTVEQEVLTMENDRELVLAVSALHIKYREVVQLFYYEDYTSREIATLLGISENTVKTRLRKAKKLLEKKLGGERHDEY